MKKNQLRVMYLYQGERYWHSRTPVDREEAKQIVRELKLAKFHAWIEEG